jgi:hypothetical protein
LIAPPVVAAQLWQKPQNARGGDDGPVKPRRKPGAASATTTATSAAPATPAKKPRRPRATGGGRSGSVKSTETLEAEVFGEPAPTATVRRKARPKPRGRAVRRDDDDHVGAAREEEDDEADDQEEQEEDDDGEALADAALPIIAPRIVSLGVATALIGRNFRFDAPLQPESTFPRAGVAIDMETFPLSRLSNWAAGFGLGGSFATEVGSAGITQSDGGRLSYPVTERRWDAGLRYALPLGQHFVAVPQIGFGASSYEVTRKTQMAPSACTSASTQVCLPDVHLWHLGAGLSARIAFTPSVGLSLSGAYLLGFGLDKSSGELGSEATASSARGVSGEAALAFQIKDWLSVRAAAPLVRYAYAFSGNGLAYKQATETYYGATLGATIVLK